MLRHSLVVFVVALGVLTLLGVDYRDDPFFSTPISDAASYDSWARRIATEGLRQEPPFHQSPLFPLALAAVYSATGAGSATAALVLQSLLMAASIALLVPLGSSLFRDTTAGIGAALVALAYAPFAFHSLKLLPIAMALATQALALLLLLRLRQGPTPLFSALTGAGLGLACLARAELLLFVPVAAWILRPWRGRVASLSALAAGLALAIAPVSVHNLRQGDFTLIASAGGENLFIGNQRGGDGGHRALDPKAGDLESQRILAKKIAEEDRGRTLTGSEVSSYWRGRAWTEIAAAPGEWLALESRKLLRLAGPGDPTDLYSLALERRTYMPSLYALPLPTAGLWLLALLGAVSLRRRGLAAAWPVAALLGFHLVVLMAFFVSTRLRLPFLFWLCPLAGVAVAAGIDHWRRGRRAPVAACALLLGVVAVADLRLQQPDDREILRLAAVLSMQGRLDDSLAALQPALERDDPDGKLLDQAGWVLSRKGRLDSALAYYNRALEAGLPPSREQQTRSRMAGVLENLGRNREAAEAHRRSIEVDPGEPAAWFERAKFRMRRGDRDGAVADLREASRLMPEWRAPREALQSLSVPVD